MRVVIAAIMLAGIQAPALAQSGACNDPQTQMAMNMCAAEDFSKADAELNRLWPQVRDWAKKTDASIAEYDSVDSAKTADNLLKAQRAWIDYRDGHCATEAAPNTGGSIVPLLISSCLAEMTRKRTKELQSLLETF